MVIYKKEGPRKEPPYNHRLGRFFNEPTVEKIFKVQIGSSRIIELFRSVPPALPKIF